MVRSGRQVGGVTVSRWPSRVTVQPIGLEHRDDLALEVDDADDLGREVDVHGDRCRVGRRADVGDVGVGDSPAVLDEQVDGELGRRGRERRVDAALEPARRLAGQLVPAGRAGDA